MRYRAFISYSHADARWASWLHRSLESYRLPSRLRGGMGAHGPLPERLTPIFRDREDLSSAGHLGPQIQQALAESEALVVVCSADAARSPWVESEILAFKRLGRSDRVYAFIVDGEPNSNDELECFPGALRFELDSAGDYADAANPIAADARAGKDGKALARLKLLAGLFGLPLDTLRQREAHRRQVRMLAITLLAVGVMLVTSVLAVQAIHARDAAQRRQKQAEALVDFMLGDLYEKLSQVSRLDILTSVNDKAMAYFRSLPDTDVTDEALEQRAKALVKIGSVQSEQGQQARALESYRAAAELSGRLAKAAPNNVARQLAHADVLAFIGLIHWYQGNLDGSQRSFDGAQQVLLAARDLAPDNPKLLYQLSTLDNNLGHVLEGRGRFEEATIHYRRMLDATQRLAQIGPLNVDWQNQLGLAYNNMAKMALLRGDLSAAITGYRADVAVEEALATRDPRNNAQRERLLISRATLARTLVLAGELEEAADLTRLAVEDAQRLAAMEPGNVLFQEDVGLYATQFARLQRLRGESEQATRLVETAIRTLAAIVATDATQPGWQRELAEAHVEHAKQLLATGKRAQALSALARARALLEPLLVQNGQDRGVLLATLEAWLLTASSEAGPARIVLAGKARSAIALQTTALNDVRLQGLLAEAELLQGRVAEARSLASRLVAAGYREPGFMALLWPRGAQ